MPMNRKPFLFSPCGTFSHPVSTIPYLCDTKKSLWQPEVEPCGTCLVNDKTISFFERPQIRKLSSNLLLLVMSLAKAVGTTFGTYMIADYLSNYLQHPTQKMDYGLFNGLIGREIDNKWWGTRTEHIGKIFSNYDLWNMHLRGVHLVS